MTNDELKQVINKWSNSIFRPIIPTNLMSKSEITGTEDDGAKLIYLKFLYGVRTGKWTTQPSNGSSSNVMQDYNYESLWKYTFEKDKMPEDFNSVSRKKIGVIPTGIIEKCHPCRGNGQVKCSKCKGTGFYTRHINDGTGRTEEKKCNCGDGWVHCRNCNGYGQVEKIIETKGEYKLSETKDSQYTGEVPEEKIKKITGDVIYEQVYEYPIDVLRKMTLGGVNAEEFNMLNTSVLDFLKESIDTHLQEREDIDTLKIHEQLNAVFESLPNPGKDNEVLKYETLPVRVMVKVENAPVKQVDYKYKEKDYSLWVYGKERSIWKEKAPSAFNYKSVIWIILLLGIALAGTYFYLDNEGYFNTSENNTTIVYAPNGEVIEDVEEDGEGDSMVTEEVVNRNGKYIIASEKYLTEDELKDLPKDELKIMRNEIYARYGYIFVKNGEMDKYFSQKSWYSPQFKNVDDKLTDLEKHNIKLIKQVESK